MLCAADHNTTCIACHRAEPFFKNYFAINGSEDKDLIFANYSKFATGNPRLTEILASHQYGQALGGFDTTNLRMLGYFAFKPTISQRIVSDNANAVAYANKLLGLQVKPQWRGSKTKKRPRWIAFCSVDSPLI